MQKKDLTEKIEAVHSLIKAQVRVPRTVVNGSVQTVHKWEADMASAQTKVDRNNEHLSLRGLLKRYHDTYVLARRCGAIEI